MRHDQANAVESENPRELPATNREDPITCPVCGEIAVQEKCKIICRSEKCRARVVMNCSEF